MANVKTRDTDRVKIVSAVVSLAVIIALVFGIFAVTQSVRESKSNNIVNLNEAEDDVAIKTDDAEIPIEEATVGDDDIINANARASMSDDGDGTEDLVTEQTKKQSDDETDIESGLSDAQSEDASEVSGDAEISDTSGTQTIEALTEQEVMANAISKYTFEKGSLMYWPVSGDITLGYNMESTVYFKTLGMYKCSPAIIIASDVGTNVCAAASGVVVDVTENTETGNTLRVAVGNGYEITTGMLDNVNLKIGDTVQEGQLIGTVAEPTAYYKEEGPGVYFAMTNDGIPVNPLEYLGE